MHKGQANYRQKRKREMSLQGKEDAAKQKRQIRHSRELSLGVADILRDVPTAVSENVRDNDAPPACIAESIFLASSGLDKSALRPEEMLQTACDTEKFNDETYCSKVATCAGCGAIFVEKGSSQREMETIYRKEIGDAFSFESKQESNSERGVRTRIDDKVVQLQLIKDLVTKEGHFYLCDDCTYSVKAHRERIFCGLSTSDQTSCLPQLTPVEKACIAGSRMYGTVVKIKEKVVADTQPLQMKGHFICFPARLRQKVVRNDFFLGQTLKKLCKCISSDHALGGKKCSPLLVGSGGVLEVRLAVIKVWLQFLQETNKYYKHVKVDFSDEKAKLLEEAVKRIVKTAMITVDATIENAIGSTLGKES